MTETRTAARMARLVAQWRKSGESGASFARRHQIPVWTFWYWQRKLSGASAVASAPAAAASRSHRAHKETMMPRIRLDQRRGGCHRLLRHGAQAPRLSAK